MSDDNSNNQDHSNVSDHTEFLPDDLPGKPFRDYNDAECVKALQRLKANRQGRSIPPSRLVRIMQENGFSVTAQEYRQAESAPLKGVQLVREGILPYAYRALHEGRWQIYQSDDVRATMQRIRDVREQSNLSVEEFVFRLAAHGNYVITAHEYSYIERGSTKKIPFDFLFAVAHEFRVSAKFLFPTLDEYDY